MEFDGIGSDSRLEVSVIRVQLLEGVHYVRCLSDGGRGAKAIGNGLPKQSAREAQRAFELHTLDVVYRNQVVAGYATGCLERIDLDVLEASETVEVRDRFAYLRQG